MTYLETRADVDADAVGAFGSGGTGGGNAILLAAADSRGMPRSASSPWRTGGLAAPHAPESSGWSSSAPRSGIAARASRARAGSSHRATGSWCRPRSGQDARQGDVDTRVPAQVELAAPEIFDYRPIDAARTLTKPLLVIGVKNDTAAPTDHAVALYDAARGPRELILQRHTSHYASYEANGAAIAARIVEWFERSSSGSPPCPVSPGRGGGAGAVRFGLLLPHFGEEADRDRLLLGARRAEELGFDSLWVRDHLLYEPHGEMERPNRTFYEALTTLTVVGAVTTRIGLGPRRSSRSGIRSCSRRR